MALVVAPEAPLGDWLPALDAQIARSPSFFDNRPVVVDLGKLPYEQQGVAAFLGMLEDRGIRIIGTEGAHPGWEGIERWGRPLSGHQRPVPTVVVVPTPTVTAETLPPVEPAPVESSALVVDHPIRSGQSILFERGDVTILGNVASGAEVMAGGSIHIYGSLRGRAIAGLAGNARARVFCRKLQAELIAIDGVYQTADDMPAAAIGKAAQAWLDGDRMRIAPLD